MYSYACVTDENPPKLKLGSTSRHGTIIDLKELPFTVPHVLAAERWVDAFKVEPFYTHINSEFPEKYFSIGDEGVCETCGDWCTVGKDISPNYLTDEQLIRIQRMGRVCSEGCALEYVFGFKGGPEISEVKKDIDDYTSL